MSGKVIKTISTDHALEILDRVHLFDSLSQVDKSLITQIPHLFQVIPENDTFIHAGDIDHSIYVLLSGEAVVIKQGVILANIAPGDFVGEVGFATQEVRTASVVAMSDLIVLTINADRFRQLPWNVREIIKDHIIEGLVERMKRMNQELVNYRELLADHRRPSVKPKDN
ncbi:Crp/Fnr family transcriptional regulator [Nitrincola sp. MINF-07-Sa-05]|uniref:Crp/Fnr family transcriptional regulator n=1 Tax=Nitrincola salilacus TaxID=3400273 RepID=UPI0039182CB5